MMKERRYIVSLASFQRHFAASMSILIGRNASTVGEFGETAQMFSLARSFAARICDMFHELALKLWPEPSSTFLLL